MLRVPWGRLSIINAGAAHPANEMLGNIRYIQSAIAMHRHRAPNRPSSHRLLRQNRIFSSPQICDVGGLLANALSGLSQIPNLARVEVSEGSSKLYDSSHNLGTALAPLVHRLSGDEEASSPPRYVVYIWKEGSWPLGEEEENHTVV
ncbi:unnamed protein product [Sphagnum tenellum]